MGVTLVENVMNSFIEHACQNTVSKDVISFLKVKMSNALERNTYLCIFWQTDG
jgi:hypothetical protein